MKSNLIKQQIGICVENFFLKNHLGVRIIGPDPVLLVVLFPFINSLLKIKLFLQLLPIGDVMP